MKLILKNKNIILFTFFTIFTTSFLFIEAEELECIDYGEKTFSQEDYDKIIEICNKQIFDENSSLTKIQGQTSGVKNEITSLDKKIKLSQAYINQKTAIANRLKKDIRGTFDDIDVLGYKMGKINKSLAALLFQRNQIDSNTVVEALLSKETISEFFKDNDMADFLEDEISLQIKEIKNEKDSLERLTVQLEKKHEIEITLASEKEKERGNISRNKQEKDRLLRILRNEEGVLKNSIVDKEKAKRSILAKKFTVASGEKVTFGEAYNIINPYKKELGMDPAFVLAILFQESGFGGKIGGNIGQCTYNQKNRHGNLKGGYTVMRNSQKSSFIQIMKGIEKNPEKQKISCPIPSDGSYGGAMGPAQFMPATWIGIRKSAGAIIGKAPEEMSPFLNRDAFIASATYLKQNYYSSSCTKYANDYAHLQSKRTLRERCAASKYYAGGNWFKYRMTYGQSVVRRADRFRRDIKTLNS